MHKYLKNKSITFVGLGKKEGTMEGEKERKKGRASYCFGNRNLFVRLEVFCYHFYFILRILRYCLQLFIEI